MYSLRSAMWAVAQQHRQRLYESWNWKILPQKHLTPTRYFSQATDTYRQRMLTQRSISHGSVWISIGELQIHVTWVWSGWISNVVCIHGSNDCNLALAMEDFATPPSKTFETCDAVRHKNYAEAEAELMPSSTRKSKQRQGTTTVWQCVCECIYREKERERDT